MVISCDTEVEQPAPRRHPLKGTAAATAYVVVQAALEQQAARQREVLEAGSTAAGGVGCWVCGGEGCLHAGRTLCEHV